MPHIFISYAKKDTRKLALRLYQMLNATLGFTAWMDETLEPGKSWARSIEKEIDRADYVVVLLSPDLNRPEEDNQSRSFVLNEIDYAQQIGKTIIPLMAQRTWQPIQIAGLEYIDLTANETAGLQRLMKRLGMSSVPPLPKPESTPRLKQFRFAGALVILMAFLLFVFLIVVCLSSSSSINLKIYRNRDTIAICPQIPVDLSELKVSIGHESYVLNQLESFDSDKLAQTDANECWCIEQEGNEWTSLKECNDSNTAHVSDVDDWYKFDLIVSLGGNPKTIDRNESALKSNERVEANVTFK